MVLHMRKALRVRVRQIFGSVKDRVAIGQVRLRGDRQYTALQVSVIWATSHKETCPEDELVSLVLQAGKGSRNHVSHCVDLLMDRLNKTKSWVVAFKCLTLIHKAVHRGGFIYKDQLSFHPKHGGRNNLNLSGFRDKSSPFSWEASLWVRWYANFLELLMEASRFLCGFFDSNCRLSSTEKILGLQNEELMAVILCLTAIWREICCCPVENNAAATHTLIRDAFRLVVADWITVQNELQRHINEIYRRLNDLTTSQVSELLSISEMVTSKAVALRQLTDLAFALNLLQPHQRLDGLLFRDHELVHIKAAHTTFPNSDNVLVLGRLLRKDRFNGSESSFKLSSPLS